jgi:hypothetical protein
VVTVVGAGVGIFAGGAGEADVGVPVGIIIEGGIG